MPAAVKTAAAAAHFLVSLMPTTAALEATSCLVGDAASLEVVLRAVLHALVPLGAVFHPLVMLGAMLHPAMTAVFGATLHPTMIAVFGAMLDPTVVAVFGAMLDLDRDRGVRRDARPDRDQRCSARCSRR